MTLDTTLYLLTGPTAVGKTAHALRWAEHYDAEIVSCDSLLFYEGMDIATAKPSAAEQARIRHHLVDIVPARQPFNVQEFVVRAKAAIEAIQARGKRVLIVGGSGFYLKAFYAPVADPYPIDPATRQQVADCLRTDGLAGLLAWLQQLNPAGLGQLDADNPRRVSRALERCLVSGHTLQEQSEAFARQTSVFQHYPKQTCLLMRSKAALARRIETRTAGMLAAGLVDEVKALRRAGFEANPSAARAIGYRETLAWLDAGGDSLDPLREAINLHTRQLVARQMKWFRHQLQPDTVVDLEADQVALPNYFGPLAEGR